MKQPASETPPDFDMEIGHAAQNALLQAVTLGLNAVPVGAFGDRLVDDLVQPDPPERVRYLLPVGGRA